MKVKELLEKLEQMQEEERETALLAVWPMFSGLSIQSINRFQNDWDGTRPYSDFRIEQDKILRMCLELETSEIGSHVRKVLNLEPLTLETEL